MRTLILVLLLIGCVGAQGQDWPEAPGPGRAVFTARNERTDALVAALTRFGLTEIESL